MDGTEDDIKDIKEEVQTTKPGSGTEEGKWTKDAVLFLLEEYKLKFDHFNDPKMKKKTVWCKIEESLKQKRFEFDAGKCERKSINLKSKYKSTKIHNKTTGNSPRTCSYFVELDDIFGYSPAITPLGTCLNLKGIETKNTSYQSESDAIDTLGTDNTANTSTDKHPLTGASMKKVSKKQKTEDKVINAMKMRNEKMTATNRFIDCFEKFISSKSNNEI